MTTTPTEQRAHFVRKLFALAIFAVAMAYFEAAVVVYLRALYYPEGFTFPLKLMPKAMVMIEIGREFSTLVMLACVAFIAASRRWGRFGWFLFLFGLWDIWYYIWLKVVIGWPSSLLDWDVLFLIPMPWIGPVIAPVLVAISMVIVGPWLAFRFEKAEAPGPGVLTWLLALIGCGSILYSFMQDTGAAFEQHLPEPYSYWWLVIGLVCSWAGFVAWQRRR